MILNLRGNLIKYKNKRSLLTPTQAKLLLLLSDNEWHTVDDIAKYMGYKHTNSILYNINNIIDRANVEIYRIRYLGYRLNTKVLIDY